MDTRVMVVASLLGLWLMPSPSLAASNPSRPPRYGYHFAHGAVSHFRQWSLAMDVTSEDTSNPNENGSFKVGFQARMAQYVIESFPDGSGILNTAFDQIQTRVNGNPVLHAIPDTYDANTNTYHRYNLLVNPDGRCNCSQLPDLIYDASGGYPHAVPLGDLLQDLHPRLPVATAKAGTTWTTPLPLAFSAKQTLTMHVRSILKVAKGDWSIASSLYQQIKVTISAQDYLATHPHDSLGSNAPVVVTGYIKITSTLSLPATDGVTVVPMNAKSGTKGTFCGVCTGYPFPLQGEEHLHLLYSQNGAELSLTDVDGRLNLSS